MTKFQVVDADELKEMLVQRNLWSKMLHGKLRAVIQSRAPARISDGGTSYIISYYVTGSANFFTIHRIVTKEGKIIHEHVKDAYIDEVRYKAKVK